MKSNIDLRTWIILVVSSFLWTATVRPVFAYKPTDPAVQELAGRGVAFIEKNLGKHVLDSELGAVCVSALACFSHTGNAEHPLVKRAIEEIRKDVQAGMPHASHGN